MFSFRRGVLLSALLLTTYSASSNLGGQTPAKPSYNEAETAIVKEMKTLRDTPDTERGAKTSAIAAEIAALPAGANMLRLAAGLSNLATEGDFGHQTLQHVADTLSLALKENPAPPPAAEAGKPARPAAPYLDLARLVRYEHVTSTLSDPEYDRAQAILVAEQADLEKIDFTLKDLSGTPWTLSSLRGKVVLVNFWATWCPPCRKEMPDLAALSRRFAQQGLIVLSISDEDHSKVASYVSENELKYPILLDPGGFTGRGFHVEGIPKTFIFDRDGKLAAQAIDMRTRGQFIAMLQQAGIQP